MAHLKKTGKKQVKIVFIIIIIILIMVCLFLIVNNLLKDKSKIIGLWTIDDYTSYDFSSNRKGKMILPTGSYEFNYEIEDNKLCIDFEDKQAIDKCYIYEIKDISLSLKSVDSNAKFSFTKIDK